MNFPTVHELIDRFRRPHPNSLEAMAARAQRQEPPLTCADAAAQIPFKSGDEVGLKSGGPAMTVVGVYGEIYCAWFDRHGDLVREEFPPECLVEMSKSETKMRGVLGADGIVAF